MGGMRDPPVDAPVVGPGPIRAFSTPTHSPMMSAHHAHPRASSTPATPMASRTPTTPHPPSPLLRSGSMPGSGSEAEDHLPPLRPARPQHLGSDGGDGTGSGVGGGGRGMCRSVSDSTLRQAASRAALHLPLPVTSLMHFKVARLILKKFQENLS